ncbi:hypothetical protein [Streptomyces sp. CB02923]|uniref:hypothetical protein n=1 Tax=Streptomyces sp. CB02923 TaxID=1718985 RepID=UPI00093C8E10|nr:hypothetical protein [Streptomyces sp. CB02923]
MDNIDDIESVCRVCGYDDGEPRWENGCPNNDICSACGAEAGLNDYILEGVRGLRGYWVGQGAPWTDPTRKPEGWDLLRQMASIPPEWR